MRITLLWFFCIAVLVCFLLPTSTLASGSKYHGTLLGMKAVCSTELKFKGVLGEWNAWQTKVSFFNKKTGHEILLCRFHCTPERANSFTNLFPYSCDTRYIDKTLVTLYSTPNGTLIPGSTDAYESLCKQMFSFLNDHLFHTGSDSREYIEDTFIGG